MDDQSNETPESSSTLEVEKPITVASSSTNFYEGHPNMKEALETFECEDGKLHHRFICMKKNCSSLSAAEKKRFEGKKDKFNHKWIDDSTISFCKATEFWW